MSFTSNNHYVPQWYQRRFLPKELSENKFFYVDIKPERVDHPGGGFHYRDKCRRLGPVSCFKEEHLYTLFFGDKATDIIEKKFFGVIDQRGAKAVEFFSNFILNADTRTAFDDLIHYLDAQKLRTPKGLDYIKAFSQEESQQTTLFKMGQLSGIHIVIWGEGVWEILDCSKSATKFIITDHPVTTYNKKIFPLSRECQYPLDARIELAGTQTIFPLDLSHCLVITNLEYVRNPWIDLLKVRENPSRRRSAMIDLRQIQSGRQISEDNVRAINYILKMRAKRYIAAVNEDWLYPENFLKTKMWNKLGDRFFLIPDPRKVSFATGTFVGYKDGTSWGVDEYGRLPNDNNPKIKEQRNIEWSTFQKAKQIWDNKFGPLTIEELRRHP